MDWLRAKAEELVINVQPGGPVPTLAAARDMLRARPATERVRPVRVMIHAGDYFLTEPLVFDPEDSGSPDAPVIYGGAPGAQPRISGGVRLAGWDVGEHEGKPCWRVRLPDVATGEWHFTRLYVDGTVRERTRLPREGYFRFRDPEAGLKQDRAGFFSGNIRADWHNLGDVTAVVLNYWTDSHLPIASVDEATGTVVFAVPSIRHLRDERGGGGARYYLENVFEALYEPSDWYLDRATGVLTYLPLEGEDPERTEVVAPRLPELLRLEGRPGAPIHDLHFVNLDWRHTEWRYPPGDAGARQAASTVPGAVRFFGARDCSFRLNRVREVAGYAVDIDAGSVATDGDRRRQYEPPQSLPSGTGQEAREPSQGVVVAGNIMEDMGAGGVKAWAGSAGTRITDNRIRSGGRIFRSAVGVLVGDSPDNTVSHNDIFDLFYTGVSVGWTWGFQPNRTFRNRIEHNHIHRIGQSVLSDMGGIYTLGLSPAMRVCGNLIHDVRCYGYGGQGLYPDEGTSYALYEANVVFRTDTGGVGMNYGRDNLVRNNVLAWGRDQQIKWNTVRNYNPFVFERNIVLWGEGALTGGAGGSSPGRLLRFDRNLYWREPDGRFTVGALSWGDWRATGRDAHSAVARPMFVDERGGDFALRADSPAPALGFRPIDLSGVGPRPEVMATGDTPDDEYRVGPCAWARLEVGGGAPENRNNPLIGPWPEQAPARFPVKALLHNAGDEVFQGTVELRATPSGAQATPQVAPREIHLGPDESAEIALEVLAPAGAEEVKIEALSEAAGFWGSVLVLPFRREIACPRLPEDVRPTDLPQALADAPSIEVASEEGVPLGVVRVGLAGDRLAVVVDVVADRVVRDRERLFAGNFVNLLSRPTGEGVRWTGKRDLKSRLALPAAEGEPARVHRPDADPAPGSEAESSPAPGGYQMRMLVPAGELGIAPSAKGFALKVQIDTFVQGVAHRLRGSTFGQNDLGFVQSYGKFVPGA